MDEPDGRGGTTYVECLTAVTTRFQQRSGRLLQFYDINGDMSQATTSLKTSRGWFTEFENGTAILEEAVMDKDNRPRPEIYFLRGRTVGADWVVDSRTTTAVRSTRTSGHYTLNDAATPPAGAWQFGTLLHFNHQPATYFGFQLGDGANNHNCDDNGFSGWFS